MALTSGFKTMQSLQKKSSRLLSSSSSTKMSAFWMPFSANRQFKKAPRMMVAAEGMYYYEEGGRKILDGTAGLWCCNAGHRRPKIVEAIAAQASELDYAPSFQMGHSKAFELAERLVEIAPEPIQHAFFTNSGSESVDTALKIAIGYHRAKGDGTRTRLIGRERGYHGTNFGGISVGGIVTNRKAFGSLLPGVDHLPHTHLPQENAFSRGMPENGAYLANELERICALHDPSNIAAVIVEPVAGSTGVLIPPVGYLKRLREICTKHGILLIFDEVITGFGRIGGAFAAETLDVTPDLICVAKGLTNGVIPMGAVLATSEVHNAFMTGPENTIELFHGYTYSGNPVACAAGLATLDTYAEEGLFDTATALGSYWEDAVHSLKDLPNVIDCRNLGLLAGIELESIPGKPSARAFDAYLRCFEKGVLVRTTADIIALSPPLIMEKQHIDELFGTLTDVLTALS